MANFNHIYIKCANTRHPVLARFNTKITPTQRVSLMENCHMRTTLTRLYLRYFTCNVTMLTT